MGYFYTDEYLEHHGIKGQKWGVRRFEKSDGLLTSEGKKRYRTKDVALSVLTNNPFSVANAVRGKGKNDKTSKALHKLALVSAASSGNPLAVAKLAKESKQEHLTKEIKKGLKDSKKLSDVYDKTSSIVKKELTKEEKEQYKDLFKKKAESSSNKEWKELDDRQREIGYSVAKRILGDNGDVKVSTLGGEAYYAKDFIDEIVKDEVRKEIPRQ